MKNLLLIAALVMAGSMALAANEGNNGSTKQCPPGQSVVTGDGQCGYPTQSGGDGSHG